MATDTPTKSTLRDLRRTYRDGRPIVCLTAYDAGFARLVDAAGVDVILVGDTLGMTVLGYPTTLQVTMEQMLHHTAAVVRGVKRALVVADMPFLSYQVTPEDALRNAGRLLTEAGADAVKLEGGREMAPTVQRLVQAGIPVMGHIGLLPQHVVAEGGYRTHGKSAKEAAKLRDDAQALCDAGAFSMVLECIPHALAQDITQRIDVPTIGIGAGPHCSGQIQVLHDILGLFEDFVPKHTHRYAHLATAIRDAVGQYAGDVRDHRFPASGEADA